MQRIIHLGQVCLIMTLFCIQSTRTETTRMRIGLYKNGYCNVKGNYAQDLDSFNSLETEQTYRLGATWSERCRSCWCDSLGAWCNGPFCDPEYDFTQEQWCLQWSPDGCCCERLGCTVESEQYDIGAVFPYGKDNPCLNCTCEIGTSQDYCLRQRCGTYHVICEEGQVTYDEKCCPHFTCPVGVACDNIPDPFPHTPQHELLDWFAGHLEPIPVGMTQHFHLDSFSTYICSCPKGGTASCRMETFSHP